MIGQRLAHYEVTAHLGSGAMGEVYQATDSKLSRSVALKFLPEVFAHDPERAARFAREAKTLAAVNHPGVAAIYGVEEAAGRSFLVMELVPGQTLEQRIGGRPLPWKEALAIGRQIAEALEAAHENGVIHRDLKPANVKVTADGRVKVLDFGLAKLAEAAPEQASGQDADLATLTATATRDGALLGTPAYMAPEQATGRVIDPRADVFALGCVLYEMLTGRRAFEGDSVSEVLSRVLEREPDWTRVPPGVPPALVRLLRLCLAKDTKQRRQSAGDVRIDLEQIEAEPASPGTPPPRGAARSVRWAWLATAVMAALVGVLAVPTFMHLREEPRPEIRLQIVTGPARSSHDFAVSPDGRSIVYSAEDPSDGRERLHLRPLDQDDARPLSGTEAARLPFWSPDSRSIGFFAFGKLFRLDLAGGSPQALATATNPEGAAMNEDGTILFGADTTSPLYRVSSGGGEVVPVTVLDRNRQTFHSFPSFLPDGRQFLFSSVGSDPEVSGLYLGSLDGEAPTRLLPTDASGGQFLAPDHIVYTQQGALLARRFDAKRGVLTGDPVKLADGVGAFSVSTTGVISHRAPHETLGATVWVDRSGKVLKPMSKNGWVLNGPELSPDERRLAGDRLVDGIRDIWVLDLTRDAWTRFTTDPAVEGYPLWSPDGSRLAFVSGRKGTLDLWIKAAHGSATEELLLEQPDTEWPIDWSGDGRFLLYQRSDLKARWDLWALPMSGEDRAPIAVATTSFEERIGEFSPDGRWVVYDTNESGNWEIVVQSFPEPSERLPLSSDGGRQPRWSADGAEIYFVAPDATMMTVPVVQRAATLELGVPVALFQTGMAPVKFKQFYAVARDGRFLITNAGAASASPPISIILDPKL